MISRSYSELMKIPTFEKRMEYLRVNAPIGYETFGEHRWVYQQFRNSREWLELRDYVIARDYGCDLAFPNAYIFGKIIIHHMNPVSIKDVLNHTQILVNPEYLVCTSQNTHNLIHYSNRSKPPSVTERRPNDTCPWKKVNEWN